MEAQRRTIETRVTGSQHGFIRRMVSPGQEGERLKPFVFLDRVDAVVAKGAGFGFHPHSGIATLTYQLNADVEYEDTAGQKGRVEATGLEWMRAAGGTWHQGFIHPREARVSGFQLWLSLPPGVEDGPAEGIYVAPKDVPQVGNVRVLLGEYGGAKNPIPYPSPVTYLDVVLPPGGRWEYTPAVGETTAWAFVYEGQAKVCGESVSNELVILDASTARIDIEAEGACRILFGSAVPHAHRLVLGSHSVHTNEASLARGVANIRTIGERLRGEGRLG